MFILIMNLFGLQKYSILSKVETTEVGNCSKLIRIAANGGQNVLALMLESNS